MSERIPQESFLIRAAAHARHAASLSRDKRFRNGITDDDVASVFLAMEALDVRLSLSPTGRWVPPVGKAGNVLRGVNITETVREMARTGLVTILPRYGVVRARPARVHFRDPEDGYLTLCHDPVEGLSQGRVRTVNDLTLVDCLECELAVATGTIRGL